MFAITIYVTIWLLILLAVLSLGLQRRGKDGKAVSARLDCAAEMTNVVKVLAITTFVASVGFAIVWYLITFVILYPGMDSF